MTKMESYGIARDAYAFSFDSMNGSVFSPNAKIEHAVRKQEIVKHFNRLKEVAKRDAPKCLPMVNEMSSLTLANFSGSLSDRSYHSKIKSCCLKHGLSTHLIDGIEHHVIARERMSYMGGDNFFGNSNKPMKVVKSPLPNVSLFGKQSIGFENFFGKMNKEVGFPKVQQHLRKETRMPLSKMMLDFYPTPGIKNKKGKNPLMDGGLFL